MDDNRKIKAHIRMLVYGPLLLLPVIAFFLIAALILNEAAAMYLSGIRNQAESRRIAEEKAS